MDARASSAAWPPHAKGRAAYVALHVLVWCCSFMSWRDRHRAATERTSSLLSRCCLHVQHAPSTLCVWMQRRRCGGLGGGGLVGLDQSGAV